MRDYVVEIECDILENSIPLTVGPGSEGTVEEEDQDSEEDEVEDEFALPTMDQEDTEDDYDSEDYDSED